MITELWDILDEHGVATGKTTVRGKTSLKQGEYHLVVHIWIISSDGKILIQRRADNKKLMPGEWAATGGAAISGENSFVAARRELFEELGIESDQNSLKNVLRLKRRNSLLDIWMIVSDVKIDELSLQKSEVAEVKWVTLSELKEMIKDGLFHNYGKDYFNQIFKNINLYRGATL